MAVDGPRCQGQAVENIAMVAQRLISALAGLCLLLLGPHCLAQVADSVMLNTVTVIDVKPHPIYRAPMGSYSQAIDSALIAINQQNLTQLLATATALNVRSNGPGGVASINLRGGSAQQTQLFWEGLPLNDPMLGVADVSVLLPLASTINVYHGPASALLGSGGLGGGISLTNDVLKEDGLSAEMRLNAGMFGRYSGQSEIKFKNGRWAHNTGMALSYAENNFAFQNTARIGFPTDTMRNSRVRQQGLNHTSAVQINERNEVSAGVLMLRNDRQLPPLMTNLDGREKMLDEKAVAHLRWERTGKRSHLSVRLGYTYSDQTYWQTDSRSFNNKNQVVLGRVGYSYQALRWLTLQVRQFTDISLGYAQSGYPNGKMQQQYGASGSVLVRPTANIKAEFSGRFDVIDGQITPPQLNLGGAVKITRWLSARASGGSNYRVPTLNDRFWQPGGNPQLVPEQSYGGEVGCDASWKWEKASIQTSLTGYFQQVENMIRWVPGPAFWHSENVNHAQLAGLEMSLSQKVKVGRFVLVTQILYEFSDARSGLNAANLGDALQMVYIPKNQIKGSFQIERWRTWLRPNAIWVSPRNVTTDGHITLPAFTVIDIQIGHRLPIRNHTLLFIGQVTNLLNQNYQTVTNNPMPGIGFDFTLSYTFRHKPKNKSHDNE